MQHFKDLKVCQRSHALVLNLDKLTAEFPGEERFDLVSEPRRAAASVPTNIAEGAKRRGQHDDARFLNIAEGSLAETEYLVLLSHDLGFLSAEVAEAPLLETAEISRMLNALRSKVGRAA